METTKRIEPIKIELPLGIMFKSVNCYLIPGKILTLIDCGFSTKGNWEIFQNKIEEHGYQVGDIEQVLVTHEHRDHIGLLSEILAHTKAIVRAPKAIQNYLETPVIVKEQLGQFTKLLFQSVGFPKDQLQQVFQFWEMIKINQKVEAIDRIQYFEEGDHLFFADTIWEVLCTPGHCLSQTVFIQKEEKRIISSDMLLPIAPMPIIMEDPDRPGQATKALVQLLQSYDRLKAYEFDTVYPGHGPVFRNANAVIELQLARIQLRKEECYDCIKDGLLTPYQINRKMYPYQQMPPDFSGLYMVLGYIDLLIEEKRILKSINEKGQIKLEVSN